MQVTELENTKLKRSLKIVVDAKRINDEMEAELKSAGERIRLPGFRPGNIPMKVLKQRYGKTVQADVLKHVISHTSNEALVQRKIRPAMNPDINIEDYSEGGDLSYTISCEVFPEVPEMSFDGITLDRHTFEVAESDIDEAAERVAKHSPKSERAKSAAKAKMGQVAVIDFKGMMDGKAFEGGSAEDFKLELGSKRFIAGFEEQLVGTKEGDDVIVNVTFPKDYTAKNLAGKEASFAVKVKEIHDLSAPKIDEEFAKERGFADLAALREAIKKQMTMEYDQAVRRELKQGLFDVLEEKCGFELPEKMIEMEFQTIWQRIQQARAEGDPTLVGKSEEELKEEYRAIAERRVKLGLLLADIGFRNKLQVAGEELNRAVMQQASQFPGQEKKVFEFYQKNPEALNELRGPLIEEKAVDFILSKVKFNDIRVSLKELDSMSEEDAAPKPKKKPKAKKAG
jgi:trigger factor